MVYNLVGFEFPILRYGCVQDAMYYASHIGFRFSCISLELFFVSPIVGHGCMKDALRNVCPTRTEMFLFLRRLFFLIAGHCSLQIIVRR